MAAIYLPGPAHISSSINTPANFTQSVVSNGAGDSTLTANTVVGGSNFLSTLAINPTNSIFTVTFGNSNPSVITVPAQSTISIDIVSSIVVIHATAANQEVISSQYNPLTT